MSPLWSIAPAGAADLGAREWQTPARHECVVIAATTSPAAREFHAAFSRHWCLQGWSAGPQVELRESRPEKWMTRVDILRDDELVFSLPMSPYVEQNVEKVAAAVVGQMAAFLMRSDAGAGGREAGIPTAKQPGSERK